MCYSNEFFYADDQFRCGLLTSIVVTIIFFFHSNRFFYSAIIVSIVQCQDDNYGMVVNWRHHYLDISGSNGPRWDLSHCFVAPSLLIKPKIECIRPDRSVGTCLSVYDCPPVYNILNKSGGIGAQLAEYLRSLQCEGEVGRFPFVCCLPTTEEPTTTTTTQRPSRPVTLSPPSTGSGDGFIPGRGQCGIEALGDKIYSGKTTGLDEFPWTALLEYRSSESHTINVLLLLLLFKLIHNRFSCQRLVNESWVAAAL